MFGLGPFANGAADWRLLRKLLHSLETIFDLDH